MSFERGHTYAPLPSTARGQAVHLNGDPKGNNILYTTGRSVIIRNLKTPSIAKEYSGHLCHATVAKYSPSGFYIASGDVNGNIRIWDTVNEENLIKLEVKSLGGRINDLDWDFESKRVISVGDGKDRFGHAFLFDSGSSCGEILAHSKTINSVSVKPSRPFRAVTGSDDNTCNFYHGTPYKFNTSIKDHARFVQCVRYSPSGEFFATCGMDSKIFLYDGKTGEKVKELTGADNSHTGGIFTISWSPDSKKILSTSADTSAKIWDVETSSVVNTYSFGDGVDYQQVGGLWQGDTLVTLGLNGDLNYLTENTTQPTSIISGHQKAITTIHQFENNLYTGSYDGRVCKWSCDEGNTGAQPVTGGGGHTNQVTGISGDKSIVTTGMDDTLKVLQDLKVKSTIPTGSIPKDVTSKGDISITVTQANKIIVAKDGQQVSELQTAYTPLCVDMYQDEVAVGAEEDGAVYIYKLYDDDNYSLKPIQTLMNNRQSISALCYSSQGLLAVADTTRTILVFTPEKTVRNKEWVFHSAKVNCIKWSPDGKHAASGGLDTNLEVWSLDFPMKHIAIKNAHLESINGVAWVDDDTVVSCGQDAIVKVWKLKHYFS